MKKNKFIIFLLVFFLGFNLNSQAEMTLAAPSTVLTQLATATSFSSDIQLEQVSIDAINETTANVVDPEALKTEIELEAAEFGKKIDEAALAVLAGDADDEQVLMVLSTDPLAENPYIGRKDLEPTLGTYIYDSGMMTLTRNLNEGANTLYNENTDEIFETANGVVQQARITVYIDFKRQVLFGDLETKITLKDKEQFNKTIVGSSGTITKGTINSQLSVVYEQDTTKITAAESFSEAGVFLPTKHDTTSLMLANGTAAPYTDGTASENEADAADMQLYISHFGGGDFPGTLSLTEANGGVLAGARIKVGNNAATGELTASLEAATGNPLDDDISNDDFVKTIIRYDQTVNVEAQIFEGDSTR
jgi:hypothetical protein